jgi:hypothetical protein
MNNLSSALVDSENFEDFYDRHLPIIIEYIEEQGEDPDTMLSVDIRAWAREIWDEWVYSTINF